MSNMLRITGMATGMDTDTMVKQMMQPYNMKLDKVKGDKQIIQWKQDIYRDLVGQLNTFKSTYFDVLKPETNMLSANNYAGFDVKSTENGSDSTTVSASAGAGAAAGDYTVENIVLAQKASKTGGIINIKQGDNSLTVPLTITGGSNDSLSININGTTHSITLNAGAYNTGADIVNEINNELTSAGIAGKIRAQMSPDSSKLQFSALTNESVQIGGNALSFVGFSQSSFSVNQSANDKMSNLIGEAVTFKINNVDFSYDFSAAGADKDKTIREIITDISDKAGVNINYSELGRKFTITSSSTGSDKTVTGVDTTGTFVAKLFGNGNFTETGTDCSADITDPNGNSTTVVRATNNFNIDGVNYNLLKNNNTSKVTISVTSNSQKTYDKIKGFIDKYNEVIGNINEKIEQKKQYSYTPLTDEQKKAMSADDIKNWEERAKEGLIRSDSNFNNMLQSMRSAFYESVQGAGVSLEEIGLSTSSDISQRGKIVIDETKLKSAIQNKGEQVCNLFTKTSSSVPSYGPNLSSADRALRSSEEGIIQRIYDILQDNVRMTRDSSGKKGILIEKAGLKGDFSEFNNLLYKEMQQKDTTINELSSKLAERENKYYEQFAKLEKAMNQMNSQSSWLSQQLGTGM